MGVGTDTSDVPQVLQKRAVAVLLAPHLGHVTTDIVYETSSLPRQLLGLTFELVWVWSRICPSVPKGKAGLRLSLAVRAAFVPPDTAQHRDRSWNHS
jgi:hypothetical protein